MLPLQDGVIVGKPVAEGQSVTAGQVLYVLDSQRSSAAQGDVGNTVSALVTRAGTV
ncbi:biotin/lipoyl-binding protein [Paludibacterium paludis]|uniref:Biotin/lipoyl-binding protein n=1 Tax=Paludibacterium paludis TaxID=1225769 RepID=A0A918P4T8_9NEIS|nr:biotin/lipoyl-binding protein [Paludibacterium paludis]GGY19534.1 hypothetical protein GCM10011289_23890 [Paludibacterium paludis]